MSRMPPDPDPLAGPLRAAAEAVAPPFSADRHAAILRHVRRATVAPRPRGRWAAVAAVVIGSAVFVARRGPPWSGDPVRPTPTVAVMLPPLPTVPATLAAMSDPVERQLADVRREVDGSSQQLARFCLRQLDVIPIASLSAPPRPPAAGGHG